MQKNVLAFDFGASSGRAIVGEYVDGALTLHEVHRFENYPLEKDGRYFWNVPQLFEEIMTGLKKATDNFVIDSLGIDTWGVDFGLLDHNGELLTLPRSYRDPYTTGLLAEAGHLLPLNDIYRLTGNQLMEINTLFQMLALKRQEPELWEKAATFLLMPDLFNYLLSGVKAAETTIASTTQLINPLTKTWAPELAAMLQTPAEFFPHLVEPGHLLGYLRPELGFPQMKIYNVCQHDTASAVVAVPNLQDFLFVSCGTWSLVGTELSAPVISEKSQQYNLTNEAGMAGTTEFLKNCTGLWIIQEIRRQWQREGKNYSFQEIADMAETATPFTCLIDTDDPVFVKPEHMIERLQAYAKKTHQRVPQTDGELARCVYESLAMKYKLIFLQLSDAAQREFSAVNIIGGGANAKILCQMVADASGCTVYAGPTEATALGNIATQLQAEGIFTSLADIRQWLKKTTQPAVYHQQDFQHLWDQQFSRYQKILEG